MSINFGVQTFTIRKHQKKSIREAYMPLIRLGIKSLEVARIDFNLKNAEQIKSLSDEFGIEVTSIQVKPKQVFGDVDGIGDGKENVALVGFAQIRQGTFGRFIGWEQTPRFVDRAAL